MPSTVRSVAQRKQDTLDRIEQDVDAWVATADPDTGTPCLIPLSYLWDGATFLLATPETSVSSRNMQVTGLVRQAIGTTRDVILVEGSVLTMTADQLPDGLADAYATRTEWEPREDPEPCLYFQVTPIRIQAYREAIELTGRTIMRNGIWLV